MVRCEIREQSDPYEVVLLGPKCHVPIPTFPAEVELSVYAHITGGHGSYDIEITLRDAEGDSVWSWTPPKPLEHPDPLEPQQLLLHSLDTTCHDLGGMTWPYLLVGKRLGGSQ